MSKQVKIQLRDGDTARALGHATDFWEGVQMAFAIDNNLTLTLEDSFDLFDELTKKVKEFDGKIL